MDRDRQKLLARILLDAALVTALVAIASHAIPEKYGASALCVVFLGATWFRVWRDDDATVVKYGLDFSGVVLPGPLDFKRIARDAFTALAWAIALGAIVFVPFYLGWRIWWHARGTFAFSVRPLDVASDFGGQLVMIALPEEAFYRGYLQSALDDVWPPRFRIFGANVGPGLILASAIFASVHIVTMPAPARLAVFFPALLFGWLRARTRGVGASIAFHALCNTFSEILGRGFGVY
jgi:membrane protease YdiL (CAAX protease family)